MATALLSIALYYFLALIKEIQDPNSNSKKNIILFNIFSALAMGVFYGSGFFIGAMIVVGFFSLSQKKNILYLTIGMCLSLLFLSPLLYQQILNSRAGLADLKNWSSALGNVDVKNIALIFLKFATGRLSWLPKWSYYLIAGIPTAITWIVVVLGMKSKKQLAYLFVLPLIFGMAVSVIAPMMMYFRFLYLIPVMSLLLVTTLHKKIPHIHIFILASYIIFSLVYLTGSQFHREDWKSLSGKLEKDIPVYMIIPSSDPIAYYRSDVSVYELRTLGSTKVPEVIEVIPYTSDLYGLNYVQLLQNAGCIKESQATFRGDLILEKWKCLRNA
jgi:hypothetical protein